MGKALRDFTGYPDGKKTDFKAGDTISADYAAELEGKEPPLVGKIKPQTKTDIK